MNKLLGVFLHYTEQFNNMNIQSQQIAKWLNILKDDIIWTHTETHDFMHFKSESLLYLFIHSFIHSLIQQIECHQCPEAFLGPGDGTMKKGDKKKITTFMELAFCGIRMGKHNASVTVEHGVCVLIYIKLKNMPINLDCLQI